VLCCGVELPQAARARSRAIGRKRRMIPGSTEGCG